MKRMIIIAGALAALAAVTAAEAARATFPGSPGKIAFVSVRDANQEIYVMNADGSGQTRLSSHPEVIGRRAGRRTGRRSRSRASATAATSFT